MRIKTKPYGEIEIDDRQRLTFPEGIFGFEDRKEYVLLDARQPPFYWLQSTDDQDIAFVMIDPHVFRPDYRPDVSGEDYEVIETEDPDDLLILAIVTIPHDDHTRMTANLQGPILINKSRHLAKQAITMNPDFTVRHLILEELAAVRNGQC